MYTLLSFLQFLDELDSSDEVGEYVDVCSDFPREHAQIKRATGIDFSEELYCLKILLGGIDSQFDGSDEASTTSSQGSSWKMRKRLERKEKMRAKYQSQREELRYDVKQLLERPPAYPSSSQQQHPQYQQQGQQQQQPYSYDIGMSSKNGAQAAAAGGYPY